MGLEPTTTGATIRSYHQLSYAHHPKTLNIAYTQRDVLIIDSRANSKVKMTLVKSFHPTITFKDIKRTSKAIS